ncbi:hypothetical protein HYU11_04030 [Candidatus Woesearchaeota archaeon]|nr:hypothetical protein [Candidatus Woesearchaeota archaeon]
MLKRCLLVSVMLCLSIGLVFAGGGTHTAAEVQGGVFRETTEYRVGSPGWSGSLFSGSGAVSVRGENNQPSGRGVYGRSTNSSGYGVLGEATTGNGVVGSSTQGIGAVGVSGSGYGVYGASTTGVSGYFDGNVSVTNMIRIEGESKGWGTSIINGRIWSANNNIHLSPPGGSNVIIDANYREAGGPTGSVGLCLNGDCRTGWPSGITGSGNADRIAVFLGPSAISSSELYQYLGKIGLGTGTPRGRLNVIYSGVYEPAVNGTNTGFSSAGVHGWSSGDFGRGVEGVATGDSAIGVWGQALTATSIGVSGSATASSGVSGTATTGIGVDGSSTLGTGTRGWVNDGIQQGLGRLGYIHPTAGAVGVYGEGSKFAGYFNGKVAIPIYSASKNGIYLGKANGTFDDDATLFTIENAVGAFGTGIGTTYLISRGGRDADIALVVQKSTPGNPDYNRWRFDNDGILYTPGGSYADIAEGFMTEKANPGDVLVIGNDGNGALASKPYQSPILGVVSNSTAIMLSADGDTPVAVAGRVVVKVSDENGEIRIGDPVVAGSRKGMGMKGYPEKINSLNLIGVAMTPLKSGSGSIVVLVK